MNKGMVWGIVAVGVIVILVIMATVSRPKVEETPAPTETIEVPLALPTATPSPSPTAIEPLVLVRNQAAGTSITIDQGVLTKKGFIAIHTDAAGKPGPVIGSSALLNVGTNTAITVSVTRRTRNGETLYAMLHTDVNGNGVYEFPGADIPTVDSTGVVVAPSFTIGAVSPSPSPSPTSGQSTKY